MAKAIAAAADIIAKARHSNDAELARMDPVPALGQHTDAILAELGWNSAAIAEMRGQGAL